VDTWKLKTWFIINGLAIVIGVVGGLGSVIFRYLIGFFNGFFFNDVLNALDKGGGGLRWGLILIPALGGAIVGPMINKLAPEAKGHGVPEVIEAVNLRGGRIRARVAAVKILASSITIGSGGSVGREGPIAQIGSTLGSVVGSIFHLEEHHVKLLVVSGLAAGISATFQSPLGGAVFGLEVIYRGLAPYDVIPVMLASIIGMAVNASFLGFEVAFPTPSYLISNPVELIYFFPFGVIMGVFSVAWTKALYLAEDIFDRVPLNPMLKPVLGGLIVGLIGVFTFGSGIMGVGYEGIQRALDGEFLPLTLMALGVLKLIATSTTIASGASGGVFAPSLYIGAMIGGSLGAFLSPLPLAPKGVVFFLVGMAALFAGASKAPLTCIIMLPEMTDNYHLFPPLILACASSFFVSSLLMDGSIYTLKLVKVEDVMTVAENVVFVKPETGLDVVSFMVWDTKHTGFPVLDSGRLVGLITLSDLPKGSESSDVKVREVMKREPVTCFRDETVHEVVERMNARDVEVLPVVDRSDLGSMVGLVSKRDAIKALSVGESKTRLLS
jgi:CIC family chloride channel protein